MSKYHLLPRLVCELERKIQWLINEHRLEAAGILICVFSDFSERIIREEKRIREATFENDKMLRKVIVI